MALMGDILHKEHTGCTLGIWLKTTTTISDLEAVCCFIVNANQVKVEHGLLPNQTATATEAASGVAPIEPAQPSALATANRADQDDHCDGRGNTHNGGGHLKKAASQSADPAKGTIKPKESGTIRVGVEKVDQIINLVGELVITQA